MKTITETLPSPKTSAQRVSRQANAWFSELEASRRAIRTHIPVEIQESTPHAVKVRFV